MKTLIYMSEEIKKKDPDRNRVTVTQRGQAIQYGGNLKLVDKKGKTLAEIVVDPTGLKSAPEHHVRAWVETELRVEPA